MVDAASSENPGARWSRVLLKVSGEAFAGDAGYGIDGATVQRIAREIVEVRQDLGVQMAIVVGGGNIWRGMSGAGAGMDRDDDASVARAYAAMSGIELPVVKTATKG